MGKERIWGFAFWEGFSFPARAWPGPDGLFTPGGRRGPTNALWGGDTEELRQGVCLLQEKSVRSSLPAQWLLSFLGKGCGLTSGLQTLPPPPPAHSPRSHTSPQGVPHWRRRESDEGRCRQSVPGCAEQLSKAHLAVVGGQHLIGRDDRAAGLCPA